MQKKRILVALLLLGACSHNKQPGQTTKPQAELRDGGTNRDAMPSVVEPTSATVPRADANAVTPAQPPAKVKIYVHSVPSKMIVHWGKKTLGLTPLTIERPRDSGPMDLVLRGSGFFPVHTRAYTVKNDSVDVKMTRLANRMSIFGAKEEIPETPDPLDPANAAVVPPAAGTPTTPAPSVPKP